METAEGIKVYIIRTGEKLKETFIVANDMKEAMKKFFATFPDIREAVIKNDISQTILIETGKEKAAFASIPFLLILEAISRDEAVAHLMPVLKSRIACEQQINEGIRKCQWIKY